MSWASLLMRRLDSEPRFRWEPRPPLDGDRGGGFWVCGKASVSGR